MITIRNAELADYFNSQADYTKQEFKELLMHPTPIPLVAVCDDCKGRKIAVIEDLFTLSEYRGRGIASSLLKKAREQAIAENAETLELCVWDFNTDAIHLYEKLGMQVQYYRMEERLNDKTYSSESHH